MTTKAHEESRLETMARRLWGSRWIVVAACASLFIVSLLGEGAWLGALAAGAIICLIVALSPERTSFAQTREALPQPDRLMIEGLTAADLASAVGDPLIFFDGQGVVIEANEGARKAFGIISAGTPLQLKFRAPEMQELIANTLRRQVLTTIEYLDRVPIERLYRVTAGPIGESGKVNLLSFRDQSEVRRIDRMRADFIANASHELRTPLASIAGFIETLRGPARNDLAARENFLQIMQNQTSRMARLIDDLLSLSRLEMKALPDASTTVDIRLLVESVIDSLNHLAAESGVTIEREFPARPFVVRGSRDELFQVFENLLENACKYGQSGGRVIIGIEERENGGQHEIAVWVRDFGPGIPEEHIPRVTERFYRVDVETSRAQKGTGLGLSIVKHILTRHNGHLSISSEIGKGAEFTVHLPVAAG